MQRMPWTERLPSLNAPAQRGGSLMSNPVAYVRFGSASLLCAAFAVLLLGCGARSQSPAGGVSGPGTSEAVPAAGASTADTSAAATAAEAFLSTLSDTQRADASFSFGDPERINWGYVPRRRAGIPLRAMNPEQRATAFGLVGSGLSERGTELAHGVIELEGILRRDQGLYFVTLFGVPGAAPWGWRFEGHHISVNATELGPHGQVVAPLFIGANPARVPGGPNAGLRLLADEEDLAFELLNMLDPQQRERAIIAARTRGDIVTRSDPAVGPMAFAGLPAAQMNAAQQRQLRRLVELYAFRMTDAAAREQLDRIERAGFERLHFAWAGSTRPGAPHYYRIHGQTVLVEYDNTQSNANHIHTVWRDLENDFGGDLLRRHYDQHSH
jgi:hypothetical protein